jgi:signal transduction histidine kinase/ActR/RegA family two-component response regulator
MSQDLENEIQTLRRALRDVLALSALPTVWTGYTTAQIANNLADVLMRSVGCDGIYLTLRSQLTVDVLRLRDESDTGLPPLLQEIAAAPPTNDVALCSSDRGQFCVITYALSSDPRDRLIVGAYREGFPNDSERLLLRVATTQALTWIERKNAEAALEVAERAAAFMAEAGETLSRSLNYDATLEAIGSLVVPRLADWCFVDLVEANGGFQRAIVAHADPADAPIARRLRRSYAPSGALFGVSRTLVEGRTSLTNDITHEAVVSVARDEDHLQAMLAISMRCVLSVPMKSGGRILGVITLIGSGNRIRFEEHDVALAEELARRASLAVDNARLFREAQEANRAKDEFLANLSHELRTPMTAILGWAHLLQLGDIDAEQMALGIDTIRQSGQAQARLIDELLDVSRIVTGKLHLTPAPLDLCEVVRAAVTAIRPAAEAKRQTLSLELAVEHLPTAGDAPRLQQVFWNLLSNAVKFTPPGGSIEVAIKQPAPGMASISVSDTGEGIPPSFLPLVFERFKQAATVIKGRTGLGLGLAIAKDLVELHGGTITAASRGEQHGSTFTVTLPLRPTAPAPAAPGRDRIALHQRRVLLVEDDAATRTLLETILRSFGAEVSAASCVADAIANASEFDPEILISDIEMPGDDGIALLHELRTRQTDLPAIAVTGYVDVDNRDRILRAGFDGFVAKPLDPHVLASEVQRALGRVVKRVVES